MDGPVSELLARPAVAAGARAVATLLHVAPDAEAFLTPVRDALEENGAETGVSAWNGMLVARMLAPDSARLRQAVAAALNVIRAPRALPRVWMC
jgi:urease accessory protein